MVHILTAMPAATESACAEAATIAKELGLDVQAQRYTKPLVESVFKALTPDEVILWSFHCPTIYRKDHEARPLAGYRFDTIPVEVLRHWQLLKDHYTFDRFEIWTSERRPHLDPLLLGTLGPQYYLLARWGLESPEHLPLREIAQLVYDTGLGAAKRYIGDFPFQSMASRLKQGLATQRYNSSTFAAAERYLGLTS